MVNRLCQDTLHLDTDPFVNTEEFKFQSEKNNKNASDNKICKFGKCFVDQNCVIEQENFFCNFYGSKKRDSTLGETPLAKIIYLFRDWLGWLN